MQNEICPMAGMHCHEKCAWFVVEHKIDNKVKGSCAMAVLAKEAMIIRKKKERGAL